MDEEGDWLSLWEMEMFYDSDNKCNSTNTFRIASGIENNASYQDQSWKLSIRKRMPKLKLVHVFNFSTHDTGVVDL